MEDITFTEIPVFKKKMVKKEQDITPRIIDWFFKNYNYDVVVEVKMEKGKVRLHQHTSLMDVLNGLFKWKIPDLGARNPFDFIILKTKEVKPFTVRAFKEGKKYHCFAERYDGKEKFEFYI